MVSYTAKLLKPLRWPSQAGADVRVGVRRRVVVDVEQPVVQALVIVAADVQARVRRDEVPVIRNARTEPAPLMPEAPRAAPCLRAAVPR